MYFICSWLLCYSLVLAAIWLIKSVIELCDMNNLWLFSSPTHLKSARFSSLSLFYSCLLYRTYIYVSKYLLLPTIQRCRYVVLCTNSCICQRSNKIFLFSSLIAHAFASIFSLSLLLYSIDLFGNINNIKCLTQSSNKKIILRGISQIRALIFFIFESRYTFFNFYFLFKSYPHIATSTKLKSFYYFLFDKK